MRGEPFVGAGRNYAWVSPHRGMIVAQVVDVAEEVAEIRLATGDWRAAEWAARQGLRAFPCDERMYRLLMRAAHAAGNIPGVQRVFRELCDDGGRPRRRHRARRHDPSRDPRTARGPDRRPRPQPGERLSMAGDGIDTAGVAFFGLRRHIRRM